MNAISCGDVLFARFRDLPAENYISPTYKDFGSDFQPQIDKDVDGIRNHFAALSPYNYMHQIHLHTLSSTIYPYEYRIKRKMRHPILALMPHKIRLISNLHLQKPKLRRTFAFRCCMAFSRIYSCDHSYVRWFVHSNSMPLLNCRPNYPFYREREKRQ